MIRFLAAALFLVSLAEPAVACGDAKMPCRVADGTYVIALPEGAGPHPAVVFLHGYGGTGAGILKNAGLVGALTARGYAVLAPQGMPRRAGGKGGSWNSMNWPERRDDVAYLEAVAADAAQRHRLDRSRMMLAGFSGGGMMTWRVACDAPALFAGYGPIAGLLWRPLPERCAGPFRMQHVHGWSDPVVPIEGRAVANGRFVQADLFKGFDLLRGALGCIRDDPDSYAEAEGFLIRRWTECVEEADLEMVLHPGGHRIPEGWATLSLDWFEGQGPVAK